MSGGTPSVAGAAGTLSPGGKPQTGGANTGGTPAAGSAGTETGGSGGNAASSGSGNGGSAGNSGNGGGGASSEAGASGAGGATEEPSAIAIAKLEPTTGSTVTGTARFEQTGDQIKLSVTLTSCSAGPHALHLHMNPDCSDDANASGGNWSPQGEGIDEITCADDGTATLEFTPASGTWSIGGASASDLLKHSVVLHTGGKAEPAGRAACGLPLVQP